MRFFVKILKGCLIGISIVVPGVSGGSMAMSMGIYDQIITFTTVRRISSLREGKALLPYALGMLVGVLLFSFAIELSLSRFPLQTAGVFVGMILGAMPMLFKQVKGHKVTVRHLLLLFTTLTLLILMPILSINPGSARSLAPTMPNGFLSAGLGLAAAAAMVVPGVSGSMLLLILGYFDSVLQHVNTFTKGLIRLDWSMMGDSLVILIPFCIGAAIGIIMISRVIKTLLSRYPLSTYYGIMGLVLASPFAVLYEYALSGITPMGGFICFLFACGGFILAVWLGKGEGTST